MRGSMDEECDNICRLSCFVVSRVLTDWQAAVLSVRTYPYAAHVMVRPLPCQHANPSVRVQINFSGMLPSCAELSATHGCCSFCSPVCMSMDSTCSHVSLCEASHFMFRDE